MANNLYPDCPALMSDGRHISDYSPRCLQEFAVRGPNGAPLTSFAYRQYLIRNADKLIADAQDNMNARFGCSLCGAKGPTYPPAAVEQRCDAQQGCQMTSTPHANGLGLARTDGN